MRAWCVLGACSVRARCEFVTFAADARNEPMSDSDEFGDLDWAVDSGGPSTGVEQRGRTLCEKCGQLIFSNKFPVHRQSCQRSGSAPSISKPQRREQQSPARRVKKRAAVVEDDLGDSDDLGDFDGHRPLDDDEPEAAEPPPAAPPPAVPPPAAPRPVPSGRSMGDEAVFNARYRWLMTNPNENPRVGCGLRTWRCVENNYRRPEDDIDFHLREQHEGTVSKPGYGELEFRSCKEMKQFLERRGRDLGLQLEPTDIKYEWVHGECVLSGGRTRILH